MKRVYILVLTVLPFVACDEPATTPTPESLPALSERPVHPALGPARELEGRPSTPQTPLPSTAPAGALMAASLGDLLAQFVPQPPCPVGNGRGMAFDGTDLYYTIFQSFNDEDDPDPNIYKVDVTGNCLGLVPVDQSLGPVRGGPLAWDGSALWTIHYAFRSFDLVRVDPASGAILSSCNIAAQNPGHPAVVGARFIGDRPDGLDWTGTSLWLSSETLAGNWAVELDPDCNILSAFNPPVMDGWGTAGIAFDGIDLWHANPIISLQFQTDLLGSLTGPSFNNELFLEDLACDDVSFPGQPVLWGNTAASFVNEISAYAVDRCPSVAVVEIDIRPGAPPNTINCRNERGIVPVAILTTAAFDATTVDHTTVIFEGARETHRDNRTGEARRHEQDVDGDGDTDLVIHVRIGETNLDCSSVRGELSGRTFDGRPIAASDAVTMVGG